MGMLPKFYRLRLKCKVLDKTFRKEDDQKVSALYRAIDTLSFKPEGVSIQSFSDSNKWGWPKGTVHTVHMAFLPDVEGVDSSFEREKLAMHLLDVLRPQLSGIGLEVMEFKTDWSIM